MLELIGSEEVVTIEFENAEDNNGDSDDGHPSNNSWRNLLGLSDVGACDKVKAIAVPVSLYGSGLSPRRRSDLLLGDGSSSGRQEAPHREQLYGRSTREQHHGKYRKTIVNAIVVAIIALTLRTQSGTAPAAMSRGNERSRSELHNTKTHSL